MVFLTGARARVAAARPGAAPRSARDVEDRYDTGSLLITSQLPIERWYEIIGEPTTS
jgi:hypothetical protein